jgi:hypothetical protein
LIILCRAKTNFYDGNNAANVTGGSTASLQSVVSTADNVDTDGRPVAGDDVARVFTGIKTITAQFTGGDTAPADGDFSNLIGSVAGTIGSGHQFDGQHKWRYSHGECCQRRRGFRNR